MLTNSEAIKRLNELGSAKKAFSFYCDFLGEKWEIQEKSPASKASAFKLEIGDPHSQPTIERHNFRKHIIAFDEFQSAFDRVIREINVGNSFLTNLTFETPIETNLSLSEIFKFSSAKYKLLVPEQFVVFSPETFVKISNNSIYSYPMKGTIDANRPNAHREILADLKEKAEHITIVDLIRNDLSQVAKNVEVTKFRFIDEIRTNDKRLIQVSSEIKGQLPPTWNEQLGALLSALLPAGSISGAPKAETVRVIRAVEKYERGFYTGICGHFDGEKLDTGVMIRFIKKQNNQLIYCSGGGITSFSTAQKEYKEMADKVYLPFLN